MNAMMRHARSRGRLTTAAVGGVSSILKGAAESDVGPCRHDGKFGVVFAPPRRPRRPRQQSLHAPAIAPWPLGSRVHCSAVLVQLDNLEGANPACPGLASVGGGDLGERLKIHFPGKFPPMDPHDAELGELKNLVRSVSPCWRRLL